MKYLTKAGVKLISETSKTRGDILQGIARKHFKLITRGRKDSEAAKRLRVAYQQNEEEDKKPKIKLSNLQNLPHPGQGIGKQTGNTNLSRNNPGFEERMEGHQTRMDNRRKVNKKMKRDVNEGIRDWFRKKKKPSQPITLLKKSSAADRGQGKKTGEGEASLGDQTRDIDNTRANKKAIDDIGK